MKKKRIMSLLILLIMVAGITLPVLATSEDVEEVMVEEFTLPTDITYEAEVVCIEDEPVPVETIDPFEIAVQEMQSKMIEIETIEDEMEWFIAYKNIVNEYKDVIDPPETIYDYFTEDEVYLIQRVVETETYDQDFISKTHVASVVLNRICSGEFGETVEVVVTTPKQFVYGRKNITESTILAVEYSFMICDTTDGALYFHSGEFTETFNGNKYLFTDEAGHHFY